MFLYFKMRKAVKGKISYDKWVDNYLVHYNFYLNAFEIKLDFQVVEEIPIKPFVRIDGRWKYLIKRALDC